MALSTGSLKRQINPPLKQAFETVLLRGIDQANFTKIEDGEIVSDISAFNRVKRNALTTARDIANKLSDDLSKAIVREIKRGDVTCTIVPNSINTIGTATNQAGPPTLLNISGSMR